MTETGLTKADGDTLMSWLYFNEDGKMEAEDQLKQAVKKRDGWLQVIDSKKHNVYSYHLPKNIPTSYQKDEMIKIFEKDNLKITRCTSGQLRLIKKALSCYMGSKRTAQR